MIYIDSDKYVLEVYIIICMIYAVKWCKQLKGKDYYIWLKIRNF